MRTIDQVIAKLPSPQIEELPAPPYSGNGIGDRIGLYVESMKNHTTNEGHELFMGLDADGEAGAGWYLYGGTHPAMMFRERDVAKIMNRDKPAVVLIQDKREWEGRTAGGQRGFDQCERFVNVGVLKSKHEVFKGTVLKDAQHDPAYHRDSADEIGCHFWVVYYHPRIVKHLAPYVRERHLVRTWHSLDRDLVPDFLSRPSRFGCLLSGAISNPYPLRQRVAKAVSTGEMPIVEVLKHPGYHRDGCHTPTYLEVLSRFKVAICTSSIYGYALRKIVEATACGCSVITDLPDDEVMPEIDGNLHRVDPDISMRDLGCLIEDLCDNWNADQQRAWAERAKAWYDYRAVGKRLADDIEAFRRNWR